MLKNQNILIIGANSRIAGEIAAQLAADNHLYLLARDREKLDATMAEAGIKPAWVAHADVRDTEQTQSLLDEAWHSSGGIDVAIIAHGFLGDQQGTEQEFVQAEQVIAINFSCVVSQLVTLANLMEQRGRGKIAVITSVAGDRGRPRNYTYGAAKGGLGLYLQGLRSRLWGRGVEVYNFRAGPVDTPMTATHTKDFSFAEPGPVATRMIALLESRRYTAYVPGFWRPVMWLVRIMPEPIFQRLKFLSGP